MKFLYLFLLLVLVLPSYAQAILINELMSQNDDVLEDIDGTHSDWIELYNDSEEVISLLGYHLSDDDDDFKKWVFPDVSIGPNAYLVVFASGKDYLTVNELHTNFKIKSAGEKVYLSDENGEVLDMISAVDLSPNISYGRFPDGGDQFLFFDNPSPYRTNEESSFITSSHPSGFYTTPFNLTLESSNNQHTIRYTTDGTNPTMDSPIYEEAIVMNNNQLIDDGLFTIPTTPMDRAVHYIWKTPPNPINKINIIKYQSFQNGEALGAVQAKTYFIDGQGANRYTFPVVSIISDPDDLFGAENGIHVPGNGFDELGWENDTPWGNYSRRGRETERPIHLHYFKNDGEFIVGMDAGIRIHGSYTRRFAQKSFKTYFRSEYGQKKIDYPLFEESPIDEYKRLHFKSSDLLRTALRDLLLQKLLKDETVDGQESEFVNLFINGEYWGIFTMQERQDEYYFLYKHDVEEESVVVTACGLNDDGQKEPLYEELIEFVANTDWRLSSSFDELSARIEVESLINYMIGQIFIANLDWPNNNYKMWRTVAPDSKWRWLLYDLDNTFGTGRAQPEQNTILHATETGSTHWSNPDCSTFLFRTVLKNITFRSLFIRRFSELLQTKFSTPHLLEQIEKGRTDLLPEINEHINRWSFPADINEWEAQIEVLRNFARERPCYIETYLLDYFQVTTRDGFVLNEDCSNVLIDTIPFRSTDLYPNPSTGSFFWEFLPDEFYVNGPLEVYDLNGVLLKKVIYTQLSIDKISFDLGDLINGLYIVHFPSSDGGLNRKVMVAR